MSKVLNAAAHGHIHETVGGSWNHYFGDEAGQETDNVMTFAHEIQVRHKKAVFSVMMNLVLIAHTAKPFWSS